MLDLMFVKTSWFLSAGAAALVWIILPTALFAQATADKSTTPPAGPPTAPNPAEVARPLTAADKEFIKDASESLYLQLAVVDIALRRNRPITASADTAKKLGDKLHPDLKKVWEELSTFAQSKKEKMRDELTGVDKRAVEELRTVDVRKFNKEVVGLLGKEGKKLAQIFDAKSIQHPVLKKLAQTYAPTFQNHVKEVEQAAK